MTEPVGPRGALNDDDSTKIGMHRWGGHTLNWPGDHPLTDCRPEWCGTWGKNRDVTRRRSTYSMPGSSGADYFRAKQEPAFEPVDDLSRFVLDRIREAETEPVADQVEPNGQPTAYRYAGYVRKDCVAFRRIAAEYCELSREHPDAVWPEYWQAMFDGAKGAMTVVANRWADHHDFQETWLLS